MEWIIQKEIPDNLINRKRIDRSAEYINLDAYVLTNRVFVGCVTDAIKCNLLKELVSKVYEIELPNMFSTKRDRPLVDARHALVYFLKKHTKYSLGKIGTILGNRTHATMINSLKRYDELLFTEDFHRNQCKEITVRFNIDMLDVDLTQTYMKESDETIANWENVKHKYL
tara:strand:+ start:373 stop:882 length:510 start_codon:yes stop_codon:yes gene_type:complete